MGLALAARILVLLDTRHYRPIHDDRSYARVAHTVVALGRFPGTVVPHLGWLPSSYRPPGWPLVLAGIWSITGVEVDAARIALALLGVAGCLIGAMIARRRAGDLAGLVAGAMLALDPLLLATGASLESETLCTTLVLGALLAVVLARDRDDMRFLVLAGLLTGAAALTRANALALVPLAGWAAWSGSRAPRRAAALAVGTACLLIAPWTIRNAIDLHHFVPVSTETGNTLAGTYNPVSQANHARWLLPVTEAHSYVSLYRRYHGPALDGRLIAAIAGYAFRHPAYPLEVLGWNSLRLLGFDGQGWAAWSLHTMSLSDRMAPAVWLGTLVVTLLAVAEVLRRRRPVAVILVPAVALLLPAALVNGEMRLAAPAQALLALLGAATVADALRRARLAAGGLRR